VAAWTSPANLRGRRRGCQGRPTLVGRVEDGSGTRYRTAAPARRRRAHARIKTMAIVVRPAAEFADVRTMLGPKRPDANVCWCLSYRIPSRENLALKGPARAARVRQLMEEGPPGVLAYDGDEVVGW